MRKKTVIVILTVLLSCNLAFGSMFVENHRNITGKIRDIQFVEEKFYPAQPDMSGSMSCDRTIPAHYIIFIEDPQNDEKEPIRLSGLSKGSIVLFADQKDAKKNKKLSVLKKGMTVRITGYELRGDEGSIFEAYFETLEIN